MTNSVFDMNPVRKATPLFPRMRGLDWRVLNSCEQTNPSQNPIWLSNTQLNDHRNGFVWSGLELWGKGELQTMGPLF